tara:strand:+ start:900 stop:1142 length:243 start_codon:yes stop_codon:yes gene_type:complete
MYNKRKFPIYYKNDIIFYNYHDIKNYLYNINFKGLLDRYLDEQNLIKLTDKNNNILYLEKINDYYNLTLDKLETRMELID